MTKNELEEILEKENLLSIYISDEKMQKRYAKYEDSINHQNIYGIRREKEGRYRAYITGTERGGWGIERGKGFDTEEEACEYLYKIISLEFKIAVEHGYMTPDGEILAEDDESNYWS